MSVLPKFAFFRGEIVPYSEAKVGVMTHSFNYGTACFDGLRGYWRPEDAELLLFRIRDHYRRFLRSTRLLRIRLRYDEDELVQITQELLRTEGLQQDCYIRPIAYKSQEAIGVRLSDLADDFTVFAVPFGGIEKEEDTHATFSSWRRVDDNAIPARGKVVGAYVNSALAKTDAFLAGYDEAILLTHDGHVAEAAAQNVFLLRDGAVATPAVTENILEGITRHSVMRLLREEMGLPVVERSIDRSEVYDADEVWCCATGTQIVAVTRLDHRAIGSGRMGPVVQRLRELYFEVVRGRLEKYRHWTTAVYRTEGDRAKAL